MKTTHLLTDPVYDWEVDTWIWQDEAACAFSPSSLFDVAFPGDAVAEGLTSVEIRDLNDTNMAAAKKICDSCPMWHLCYSSASPEDFEWSMRAGIMPPIPFGNKGRPLGPTAGPKPSEDPEDTCSEGHNDWQPRSNGSRYCRVCSSEYQKKWRNKQAKKPRPKRVPFSRGIRCSKNHDEWVARTDRGSTGYVCRPCKAERDLASVQKKRAAAKVRG